MAGISHEFVKQQVDIAIENERKRRLPLEAKLEAQRQEISHLLDEEMRLKDRLAEEAAENTRLRDKLALYHQQPSLPETRGEPEKHPPFVGRRPPGGERPPLWSGNDGDVGSDPTSDLP